MRKEGVVFLIVLISGLIVFTQTALIVNAFALFLLAGIVPGTQLAFSSSTMLALTLSLLLMLMCLPLRYKIVAMLQARQQQTHQIDRVSRRRFKQIRL